MSGTNNIIGIGLRSQHYQDILEQKPDVGWLEVHSENYFFTESHQYQKLKEISQLYPISFHGIALSLGSCGEVCKDHLVRIKKLTQEIKPILVSEHLSWSRFNNQYLPDLLPVAYTDESAEIFIKNIRTSQQILDTQILIENPSSYFEYEDSYIDEAEFLAHIASEAGTKILLDVNNIFVSCNNHGWDSKQYLDKIPSNLVGEIHLAGHSSRNIKSENSSSHNKVIRVDTHNNFVCPEVWDLYRAAIEKFGIQPTLLEWDQDIPSLDILVKEANKAKQYFYNYNITNSILCA